MTKKEIKEKIKYYEGQCNFYPNWIDCDKAKEYRKMLKDSD